jgi:hypothetical protein
MIMWSIHEDSRAQVSQGMFIGLVAGTVLGVLVESVTALVSTPRQPHPFAAFAAFVGPRIVLWTLGLTAALSLVLLFAGAFPEDYVWNPAVTTGAGLFFGLFGGQQAIRLLLITPPGMWLLGALGRAFLSYSGELPWRLRSFLRHVARIGLGVVGLDGGFVFRHQLFQEYLAERTTEHVHAERPSTPSPK